MHVPTVRVAISALCLCLLLDGQVQKANEMLYRRVMGADPAHTGHKQVPVIEPR